MRTYLILPVIGIAASSLFAGCVSHKRSGTLTPRARPLNPPEEVSVGRNFAPSKYRKLAVVFPANPLDATIGSPNHQHGVNLNKEGMARLIEDEFIAALLQKGYTVASRSDVETAIQELKIQHSKWTDSDASRLGRMINVPGIIIVSGVVGHQHFAYKGRSYVRVSMRVSARLLNVEKTEVVWLGTKTFSGDVQQESAGIEWIGGLFREIAQLLPNNS